MFKFIKKEHYNRGDHHGQIVITYSVSEIIMGLLLVTLVTFYIYNYLSSNLGKSVAGRVNYSSIQKATKIPTLPKK